jgi:hypothetical protein
MPKSLTREEEAWRKRVDERLDAFEGRLCRLIERRKTAKTHG